MMNFLDYMMSAFEVFGWVWFFDVFLDIREWKYKWLLYPLLFFCSIGIEKASTFVFPQYGNIIKSLILVVALTVVCRIFYLAAPMVAFFFSVLNYILLFFVDCAYACLFGIEKTRISFFTWIGIRLLWLGLISFLWKSLPDIKRLFKQDRIIWKNFVWLPVFSGMVGIYFYYLFLSGDETPLFYFFVSMGIVVLNVVALFFLQDSLQKEEKLYQSEIQLHNKQNQLQMFCDMQALYERQGKKLHDYKKQLLTVSELIDSRNFDAAGALTRELTESISVEASEVNTGHPVINAVLNQEYRIAKSKGIGIIISVGLAEHIRFSDEDIVVVFGNLLENAIHECEKIAENGKNTAIQVKLSDIDGETVIIIQNPVLSPVHIKNNSIVDRLQEGHGIGLSNVRETVEKYGGSFAISCDDKEFTAVVII
ncbi:MAG: GHKL domain-containing protein [Oribacterium sp.]|nr:GHKL domain-containing protein [Oribacterium sp.]